MASKTEIGNLALARLGNATIVANLETESTLEAQLLNAHFNTARDAVLTDFDWPFAGKYFTLDLVGGTSDERVVPEWQYSYGYPDDCLKIRRLVVDGVRATDTPPPFALSADDTDEQTRLIYTDLEDAVAFYTRRITDPERFSAQFVQALAWHLASIVAAPLTRMEKRQEYCEARYIAALKNAARIEGNEREHDKPLDATWIAGR